MPANLIDVCRVCMGSLDERVQAKKATSEINATKLIELAGIQQCFKHIRDSHSALKCQASADQL